MMLGIEDILCELADHEEHGFPPGFRFHPTDEELITFYLASKVFHGSHSFFPLDIAEVDLNKCEPWDLPDVAKMGKREWYFYCLRDRKYPTGLRTNRATATGYWKATGKDKEIHSAAASAATGALIGMKKTLVFYLGRAPRGQKTKWVMHEYRLHGHYSAHVSAAKVVNQCFQFIADSTISNAADCELNVVSWLCQEEWVICRICRKTGEKINMPENETLSPFEPWSSSTASKESFLPQLAQQFLKNQTSVLSTEYTSNEDNHREPQMYNDALQAKVGPFASSYHFEPASTFYPATDIGVNPSASFSSMLIRSLITNADQNNSLIQTSKKLAVELVKTEPVFPYMLPGADDFEWIHGLQQPSGQCSNYNSLDTENCNSLCIDRTSATLEVELSGGRGAGGLQMVVDHIFRIPTVESRALDA